MNICGSCGGDFYRCDCESDRDAWKARAEEAERRLASALAKWNEWHDAERGSLMEETAGCQLGRILREKPKEA